MPLSLKQPSTMLHMPGKECNTCCITWCFVPSSTASNSSTPNESLKRRESSHELFKLLADDSKYSSGMVPSCKIHCLHWVLTW